MNSLHRYLRAIGFSEIKNRKDMQKIIDMVVQEPGVKEYVEREEDTMFVEYGKEFAESIGLAVRGEIDENNDFHFEYSFPYFKGLNISTREDVIVERHAEKESYAGVCDDIKVGVSLIFYLQNALDYLKEQKKGNIPAKNTSVTLAALSCQGSIMFPIVKNEKQVKKHRQASINRNHLIAAARDGDEEAIESLTLEDIDTYTTISRKILHEDVFSLVDTYFMPYGIECDQYSVLGEIQETRIVKNKVSGEEIYIISVECNDLLFDICINKKDLLGEPEVGRRFKGSIWLQGEINFPS